MPAGRYDFRPSGESMSFGRQVLHIAGASVYRFWEITGAPPPFSFDDWEKQDAAATAGQADKAVAIEYLRRSFDYVIGLLPTISPDQMAKPFVVNWKGRPEVNARQMMANMFMHVAHHRAQCEIYLRIEGIQPPPYRF
jgi:uncharacterized damage-inducible protein DinB